MSGRYISKRLVVGAAAVALMLQISAQQPVSATVALTCSPDQRAAADKLPQVGVISHTQVGSDNYYNANTIDNNGDLDAIFISSLPSEKTQIVSVWQNGTSCTGGNVTRNAWAATPDGHVYGDNQWSGPPAVNYGDMAGKPLNKPIVGMSPTSTGKGYWLVASDGGIFSYGDATFHGSMGGKPLNKPIVGMATTPTGNGYWLVASDGGMFSYGDANFYGSMGGKPLNRPITGMITTPSGHGYWMTADDGGIFSYGDATFHGSMGGKAIGAPIAGMVPNGSGYTLIDQDSNLYRFA